MGVARDLNKMCSQVPGAASVIPAAMRGILRTMDPNLALLHPNYYLPVSLGGLGVDPQFGPHNVVYTRNQRRIAAAFIQDPSLAVWNMTSGRRERRVSERLVQPWKSHWRFEKDPNTPLQQYEMRSGDGEIMSRFRSMDNASRELQEEWRIVAAPLRNIWRFDPVSSHRIDELRQAVLIGTQVLAPIPPLSPVGNNLKNEGDLSIVFKINNVRVRTLTPKTGGPLTGPQSQKLWPVLSGADLSYDLDISTPKRLETAQEFSTILGPVRRS